MLFASFSISKINTYIYIYMKFRIKVVFHCNVSARHDTADSAYQPSSEMVVAVCRPGRQQSIELRMQD